MKPFQQWRCDSCGETIEKPEDGWVEWRNEQGRYTDFHIVHHTTSSPRGKRGCYQSDDEHMHLDDLLGPDGLAWLLGIIDRPQPVDQPAFAELVRRLQIPHYEAARNHPVDPDQYDLNGIAEYTQKGIQDKLSLPRLDE